VVASVYLVRSLSAVAVISFLVATVIFDEPRLMIGAGIAFAALGIAAGIHLAEANKARCPVCTTALFAHTGCSKHKTARRILGSYRLHTAAQILTRPLFHCHHCGEGVLCRSQPKQKPADISPANRRRVTKSRSRVPIRRLPERNIPLPSSTHVARTQASSQKTTLPS
jgi:hypothetical protein